MSIAEVVRPYPRKLKKRGVSTRSPHAKSPLIEAVDKRRGELIRKVNDAHIFVGQAITGLEEIRARYAKSSDKTKKYYKVPSRGKTGIARRTDEQLKAVYNRFLTTELYGNFIVALVSQCEAFLFDVLRSVIKAYPHKVTVCVKGLGKIEGVSVDLIIGADSRDAILAEVIELRLQQASFSRPATYLAFLHKVLAVDIEDSSFAHFVEIKAARDLIVHNNGNINKIYLEKAGAKARGTLNNQIPIDRAYFDLCVTIIKKIAASVYRSVSGSRIPVRRVQPGSPGKV